MEMRMADEWEWLDRLASSLGEQRPSREEIGWALRVARDVAHGVERKLAPVSTYVAGAHVARRKAEGASAEVALREVDEAVAALLPADSGRRDEEE
jgi:hypothetical protein